LAETKAKVFEAKVHLNAIYNMHIEAHEIPTLEDITKVEDAVKRLKDYLYGQSNG
jgi:hypothetical protein